MAAHVEEESAADIRRQKLVKYDAPAWAHSLKTVPTSIIKLAMKPTPISEWKLPGAPADFQVLIKRDDMTGNALAGNKSRSLEFILSEAVQKSCGHVITGGTIQSNHCRTTAAAAAELGLDCHLFIQTGLTEASQIKFDGNMLVNRLCGAHMHFVPRDWAYFTQLLPAMNDLAAQLEKDTGKKAYVVPIGASGVYGLWGYLNCFAEIREQGVEFDDLVAVCGGGGTVAGLAIANYLCGSPYKVHGIRIARITDPVVYINKMINLMGIPDIKCEDILTLYEDYIGLGYALNQKPELEFITTTAMQTGILLDNVYTAKGAYGLSDLLQKRPETFKGKRVLFVNTGGITPLHTEELTDKLLPLSTKSTLTFHH